MARGSMRRPRGIGAEAARAHRVEGQLELGDRLFRLGNLGSRHLRKVLAAQNLVAGHGEARIHLDLGDFLRRAASCGGPRTWRRRRGFRRRAASAAPCCPAPPARTWPASSRSARATSRTGEKPRRRSRGPRGATPARHAASSRNRRASRCRRQAPPRWRPSPKQARRACPPCAACARNRRCCRRCGPRDWR